MSTIVTSDKRSPTLISGKRPTYHHFIMCLLKKSKSCDKKVTPYSMDWGWGDSRKWNYFGNELHETTFI